PVPPVTRTRFDGVSVMRARTWRKRGGLAGVSRAGLAAVSTRYASYCARRGRVQVQSKPQLGASERDCHDGPNTLEDRRTGRAFPPAQPGCPVASVPRAAPLHIKNTRLAPVPRRTAGP